MNQITATYIDHMGNDYSPIRAAIVSNGLNDSSKYIDDALQYTQATRSLIQFLARGCTTREWHNHIDALAGDVSHGMIEQTLNHMRHMPPHWTPFGHTAITVHCKAPLFVARQMAKSQVGFIWNEISRRYVDEEPEFYQPKLWRGRAADKKQGSEGAVTTQADPEFLNHTALRTYLYMIEEGVAPEQARMVLPQSMLTEWYWTGNLYGFSRMFIARTDPHTQQETRELAHMIGDIIAPLYPISWAALTAS